MAHAARACLQLQQLPTMEVERLDDAHQLDSCDVSPCLGAVASLLEFCSDSPHGLSSTRPDMHVACHPRGLPSTWPAMPHTGVDIVESVIARNKQWFHDVPEMEFHTLDFSKQPLPQPPAGNTAIFSRDALQHLSFRIVCDALENFVSSKASHLIVGSYRGDTNRNISVGEYFSIDLLQDPFMLPEPWDVIEEETEDGKLMMVYRLADLKRKLDFRAMRRRAEKLAAKQAQEVAMAQRTAAGSSGKPAAT